MKANRLWWMMGLGIISLVACGGQIPAAPTAVAEIITTDEAAPPPAIAAPTLAPTAAATRVGADYVLLLPREAAVPAGWLVNPAPVFETRQPAAGDTYRYACQELPARSVGQASVGYRNLEGLPNVFIEYVIYPTAEIAAEALADMQAATNACGQFTIGEGEGATQATFEPLEFPAHGDAGFAAALATRSAQTGGLLTHVVKVRLGHVIIGVSHANAADGEAPDLALTESLVALAVSNLADGPLAPGR